MSIRERPTTPRDTYRLAQVLVDRHGDNAVFVAAAIAEELHDEGNEAGNKAWKQVVKAIIDLIEDVPPIDAQIH